MSPKKAIEVGYKLWVVYLSKSNNIFYFPSILTLYVNSKAKRVAQPSYSKTTSLFLKMSSKSVKRIEST